MIPWEEPFSRFSAIFAEAKRVVLPDPNAMQLATSDGHGRVSVRTVLLKDFDERGFVFYTNGSSRKARDIAADANVALNFYWGILGTQVRVEGRASAVSDADSDAYFATRPRPAQIGAWASLQGEVLKARANLEARVEHFTREYAGREVPRPLSWGGWRVAPDAIEFWRAHPDRLHWRDVYTSLHGNGWTMRMLYP